MSYIFLASPYTHAEARVRNERHRAAEAAVHWMLTRRLWVYSPIVHNHYLAEGYELPMGGDFWIPYSQAMLRGACALWILDIDGTEESNGIREEIRAAMKLHLPCDYLYPTPDGGYTHPDVPKELNHATPTL